MSETADVRYVRLRPYDPAVGQMKITETAPWGQVFTAGDWEKVTVDSRSQREALDYLANHVYQREGRPESGKAFDVCTLDEAREIIRREKLARLRKVAPRLPHEAPSPPATGLQSTKSYLGTEFDHELEMPTPEEVAPHVPVHSLRTTRAELEKDEEEAPTVRRQPTPPPPASAKRSKRKPAKRAATKRKAATRRNPATKG